MKLEDACNDDRIEDFLSNRLASDDEAQLLAHLEGCRKCRERMDKIAANQDTWDSARSFLVDECHDSIQLSGLIDLESGADADATTESSVQVTSVLGTLAPTDDPDMLGRLGPYEVSGVIGAGGMGVVLKGVDRSLDRVLAIKILAPHLATSGAARKRFAREAKAAAAVLHPNVMPIHGVMNGGPLPYLVMPYMRGASLQKRIDDQGTLTPIEVLRVGAQVAAGLAAAHTLGLVHRDIKPANIMLADGLEQVAITDFGLARAVDDATMTRSGVIAGTPQYMSPEQACGGAIDARSDLFSLGSLIYAMCTGHSPFRAETSFGVLRRITDESPRPIREINPEIPSWLCRLVDRLHHKRPEDRIQSAREVEQLMNQCLAHLEQPDVCSLPQSLAMQRIESTVFSRWALMAVVACVLVASVALFIQGNVDFNFASSDSKVSSEKEVTQSDPSDATTESIPVGSALGKLESTTSRQMQTSPLDPLWAELDEDFDSLLNALPAIESLEAELTFELPDVDQEDRQPILNGDSP